jgi:hypothetical protein
MVEKQDGTTARGATGKDGNQKQAPPEGAPQNAAAPKHAARQGNAKKGAARSKGSPKGAAKKSASRRQVSPEERFRMIQEAAYYRAEKEGFNCDPWSCWLGAEAEIDAQIDAQLGSSR